VKVRFQADADLNEDIVKGVLRRESRVDFRTATASNLRSLSDAQVLALAASDGRILVSHDRKTMPGAFAKYIQANTSSGVLIVSQKTDLLRVIDEIYWCGSPPRLRNGRTKLRRFHSEPPVVSLRPAASVTATRAVTKDFREVINSFRPPMRSLPTGMHPLDERIHPLKPLKSPKISIRRIKHAPVFNRQCDQLRITYQRS
jgi:hypothetical protein